MGAAAPVRVAKKRKHAADPVQASAATKKPRPQEAQPQSNSLIGPHEPILSELRPKYNVLGASVISSTQIRKRVAQATKHLLQSPTKPCLVLLHARAAEVGKMITVVEQCKRVLKEEGRAWYQYNQLYELAERPKRKDIIEETVLGDGEDDDSDEFEVMESRFETALLPPPPTRKPKSLRIFLTVEPVPELKSRESVTMQSSENTRT